MHHNNVRGVTSSGRGSKSFNKYCGRHSIHARRPFSFSPFMLQTVPRTTILSTVGLLRIFIFVRYFSVRIESISFVPMIFLGFDLGCTGKVVQVRTYDVRTYGVPPTNAKGIVEWQVTLRRQSVAVKLTNNCLFR